MSTKSLPVLMVDDNEGDRRLAEIYLEKAWPFQQGVIVEHADNTQMAVEKMRHQRYALVIMDWNLPPAGGEHVLRSLRQRETHTPAIVLSGAALATDLKELSAVFLNKNALDPDSLRAAIVAAFDLSGTPSPPAR